MIDFDDRRTHEAAARRHARGDARSAVHLRTGRRRCRKRRVHRGGRVLVDQRPDERALDRRVTDWQSRIGGEQPLQQIAGDRLVDDQPPQRRTPLTARADGGKDNRPHGKIDIG